MSRTPTAKTARTTKSVKTTTDTKSTSTTKATPVSPAGPAARERDPGGGIAWWFSDAGEMALRNLKHLRRTPDLMMYALIQPVMFILLFRYVLGGAIDVPGDDYGQFLLPGIFVQMVLFGSVAGTAVGVADDMSKGIMDRFRSMPVSRSAVLAGRTFSELARTLVAVVVMIVVGLLVGFRFDGDPLPMAGAFLLLFAFGYAFSWLAALIGMAVSGPEAAQAGGTAWLFPFTFISSVFVPVSSMPGWLRPYAEHSPVTVVVDTLRAWLGGTDAGSAAWQSLAWTVGIATVCAPLAVARYRNK
ncbi:ABC transporter permease [Embleya scabrispora]|uniref:ABC transporter permease n=1 Tax=Embleya scabrispora TaxID=159449 RepID=UPI0003728B38|nr:ABC transporter permease [Embleya scabrispora]MYS81178.1 ABC transporter permease [Streptomyces sp. SID5474]